MKPTALLTAVTLLTIPALSLTTHAQESKPKKKPAPEKSAPKKENAADKEKDKEKETGEEKPAGEEKETKKELTKEQTILKTALENHAKLTGFHIHAVLKTPAGDATLTGSLGQGSLSLDCTDVKGVKKKRLVAGGEFYLSEDDGKTWKSGDDADRDATLLFNNIITAPVQMQAGILEEKFTAKEEKLDGETVTHIEKPAKGESAAVHFWICKEPKLNNTPLLRKAQLAVSGDDLEIQATITYSKFTDPVEIKAPEVK